MICHRIARVLAGMGLSDRVARFLAPWVALGLLCALTGLILALTVHWLWPRR